MARLQVFPFPDGSYALVMDEVDTLNSDDHAMLVGYGPQLRDLAGARCVLVFGSTVEVVR